MTPGKHCWPAHRIATPPAAQFERCLFGRKKTAMAATQTSPCGHSHQQTRAKSPARRCSSRPPNSSVQCHGYAQAKKGNKKGPREPCSHRRLDRETALQHAVPGLARARARSSSSSKRLARQAKNPGNTHLRVCVPACARECAAASVQLKRCAASQAGRQAPTLALPAHKPKI